MLTSTELKTLSGVPGTTLDGWIADGHLKPTNNNAGYGSKRGWSMVQAVAVRVAMNFRRAGFSTKKAGQIAQYIANMSDADLASAMKRGETFVLPLPSGCELIAPPAKAQMTNNYREALKRFDLGETYKEVQRRLSADDILPNPDRENQAQWPSR